MNRQNLNSSTLAALDSSPDAPNKATQQYFTPYDWAEALAVPLTYCRPVITDLHCGSGNLPSAAANDTTVHLLGHDLDPKARIRKHPDFPNLKRSVIHHDITKTFPLLEDTGSRFDLLTLNPPFSLRWKQDDLPSLRGSDEGEIKGKFIDSTHATIRMANALMAPKGEALIICNTQAYERLVAKYPGDFKHLWLAVKMPSFFPGVPKSLSVTALYLAKWHHGKTEDVSLQPRDAGELAGQLADIRDTRRPRGKGITETFQAYPDTFRTFEAVKDEIARRLKHRKSIPNISLDADGNIRTNLTSYQKHSVSITPDQARALKSLHGAHPYQLVLQKASRNALDKLVNSGVWTICPGAKDAIQKAIASYNHGRVSLTPLNPIQRLGWIDEEESILCTKDFPPFQSGQRYPIKTSTVRFLKKEIRPCIRKGKRCKEEVEIGGHDLHISIMEPQSKKMAHFMHIPDRHSVNGTYHDLQALAGHFEIPQVPDVAQAHPTLYQANLARLDTMLRAPYQFKKFQKEDIARAACVDGLIFGHVQGLGKSLAAFAFPILKGARRVLIVAPGGLHKSFRETAARFLGKPLPVLNTIADLKRWKLDQPPRENAPIQFFITSYEALTQNGGDEWEPERNKDGEAIIRANDKKRILNYHAWAQKTAIARLTGQSFDASEIFESIGTTVNGITCLWRPTMATVLAGYEAHGAGFDALSIDEATRLQSTCSRIAMGVRKLNPKYRILLTGTPIKNKVDSIFHLLHYAAGGHSQPTARFPFNNDAEAKERFANLHLEKDRFTTREKLRNQQRLANYEKATHAKIVKRSSRICNIHHLWKLTAPTIIRRRKDDCGEDIVERTFRPIVVKPGSAQLKVYGHHLKYRPVSPKGDPTTLLGNRSSLGYQLNILRQVALSPDDPDLKQIIQTSHADCKASWTPWTPKLSTVMTLIAKLLREGEQVIIGSPFRHFNETVNRFLVEAEVPNLLLDGQIAPSKRGLLVNRFKNKEIPVIVAGLKAMGEGHSLECCSHLITPSISWAYDENDQFIDRIWRLNSKKPVTIYPIITEGFIDELMHSTYADKRDSAQLALDARLSTDQVDDINPEILLADAYDKYRSNSESIPEETLVDGWPSLRESLTKAARRYREFHPLTDQGKPAKEDILTTRAALTESDTLEDDFSRIRERNKARLLQQKKASKICRSE